MRVQPSKSPKHPAIATNLKNKTDLCTEAIGTIHFTRVHPIPLFASIRVIRGRGLLPSAFNPQPFSQPTFSCRKSERIRCIITADPFLIRICSLP